MNFLLTKLLKWIAAKFNGHKTKIGGAGMILLGLIGLLNLLWPDTVPGIPAMDLDGIIASISGGFVAIGIGGKLDKNTAAVKEAAYVPIVATLEAQGSEGRTADVQ